MAVTRHGGGRPDVLVALVASLLLLSSVPGIVVGVESPSPAASASQRDAVRLDGPLDPAMLTEVDGTLFFTARARGDRTRSLWRSDGTNHGTYPIEVCRTPLVCGTRRPVRGLIGADDLLYFTTVDGLWRSDGTSAGTFMVAKDADVTDPNRSAASKRIERRRSRGERDRIHDEICFALPLDGLLYIVSERHCIDPYPQQLWVSDGTLEGTRRLSRDVASQPGFVPAPEVGAGRRLFFANDRRGSEPWMTDGTPTGTRRLRDIRPGPMGSSDGLQVAELGDQVVFVADDGTHGRELWVTDGTRDGTRRLADTRPGKPGGVTSDPFIDLAGRTVFVADDGTHGRELWSTDGTAQGTGMVRDVRPGPQGSITDLWREPIGDVVYFTAADGERGEQLWASDGTEMGTVRLTDIEGGLPGLGGLREAEGRAVFVVWEGEGGASLWGSDGSPKGTTEIATPCPTDERCDIDDRFDADGVVYFSVNAREVWRSDGTAKGTFPLGVKGRRPEVFQMHDGWVYFTTDTRDDSRLLWRTDGSRAATEPISRVTGSDDPMGYLPTSAGLYVVHGDDLTTDAPCYRTRCHLWFIPHDRSADQRISDDATAPGTPGGQAVSIEGFPDRIGDRRIRARHLHGPDWLGSYERDDPEDAAAAELIEEFVAVLGRDIGDLRLSYASQHIGGRPTTITAVRLDGAEREALIDAVIPFLFTDTVEPAREREQIAGKRVIRVKDAAIPGSYPRYIYPKGDVVWLIEADKPVLSEIIRELP